jgi:hypothetical protein
MQVMQVDAVHGCAKLRKRIQRRLLRTPVKALAPVIDEGAHVSDIGAIGPGLAGRGVRETRPRQTLLEIGDIGVGHVKRERFRLGHDAAPLRRLDLVTPLGFPHIHRTIGVRQRLGGFRMRPENGNAGRNAGRNRRAGESKTEPIGAHRARST